MVDKSITELLIDSPVLEEFFCKEQFSALKYREERVEVALHLLSISELSSKDELAVEEIFDLLSDEGFRFLCPMIIQAYIDNVFKFDGNLAERFAETIWFEELCNDRKFGRGKRADMFARYKENLLLSENQILTLALERLEMLA